MDNSLATKEKLSRIKEGVFLKSEVPWLKEYYLPDAFEDTTMKYAYCIYIDLEQEKRPISSYLSLSKKPRVNYKPVIEGNFVNYLREYDPKEFEDLLLLTDSYPIDIKSLRRDYYHDQSPTFEVFESILKPSQGIVLWDYQLENLLKIFFHPTEVTFIRRDFNAGKIEVREKMKLVSINKTLSLEDLLSNRMLRNYTKLPNIKGAYELFRWLSS
jgi:hypothetical protein